MAALLLSAAPALHAQITIGNVRAAQRAGTKLVDIDYDLTGIATPCKVWVEISADGGATWAVPATTVSGAVGNSVTPGTDLRITWNAGLDWNAQTSAQTRFRVKASDLLVDLTDLAAIPGGNFTMGDNLDGMSNALPVHTVNVSAFYMGKKEVTKAQWDEVRNWALLNGYTDLPAGAGKAADHPVQTVSWYDVVKWCNAKSEKEGLTPCYYTDEAQTAVYRAGPQSPTNAMVKWGTNGYRLPTEAEWEKAARGGLAGKRFPWGDTINHSFANYYNGNYSYESPQNQGYHPTYAVGGTPYTSPVGSFAANGYGLCDMGGNVWEWCWDWYDGGYYSSSPAADPRGPDSGSLRVRRGGSWSHYANNARCANRYYNGPGGTCDGLGCRLARGQ